MWYNLIYSITRQSVGRRFNMKIFLWIISLLWIIVGISALISPVALKKFYNRLTKSIKPISILPLIAGLLFLWSAPASKLSWLIRILGILGLIKGLFFLLCPISIVRSTLNWWLNLSTSAYRLFGIIILIIAGLVMLSIL